MSKKRSTFKRRTPKVTGARHAKQSQQKFNRAMKKLSRSLVGFKKGPDAP